MHEVLVNRLGGLSLPRKSVIRLTDRPDMTLDRYRGRKTTHNHEHRGFSTLSRATQHQRFRQNLENENEKLFVLK